MTDLRRLRRLAALPEASGLALTFLLSSLALLHMLLTYRSSESGADMSFAVPALLAIATALAWPLAAGSIEVLLRGGPLSRSEVFEVARGADAMRMSVTEVTLILSGTSRVRCDGRGLERSFRWLSRDLPEARHVRDALRTLRWLSRDPEAAFLLSESVERQVRSWGCDPYLAASLGFSRRPLSRVMGVCDGDGRPMEDRSRSLFVGSLIRAAAARIYPPIRLTAEIIEEACALDRPRQCLLLALLRLDRLPEGMVEEDRTIGRQRRELILALLRLELPSSPELRSLERMMEDVRALSCDQVLVACGLSEGWSGSASDLLEVSSASL